MSNDDAIKNLIDRVYAQEKKKIEKFLTLAGLMVEGEAKKNFKAWTQYGTGTTAATIVTILVEEEGFLIAKVGSPSKVFYFREFGTGPHKTSTGSEEFIESVTKWGKRQGMSDEEIDSVIFFIRKNGTRPRPALYPAYYQSLPKIKRLAKELLA